MESPLVAINDNAVGKALGGVARSKVYKLIDEGLLTRVNIGTRAFVTRESIDAYLARLIEAAEAARVAEAVQVAVTADTSEPPEPIATVAAATAAKRAARLAEGDADAP
jgi:hypothetical protein